MQWSGLEAETLVGSEAVCPGQGPGLSAACQTPLNANAQVKCGSFVSIDGLQDFIGFSLLVLILN